MLFLKKPITIGIVMSLVGLIGLYHDKADHLHLLLFSVICFAWGYLLKNSSAESYAALLENISAASTHQFGKIQGEVEQMQGLLADAIEKLTGSFTSLEELTLKIRKLVENMTMSDSGEINIENFIAGTEEILTGFVKKTLKASTHSKELVKKMDHISKTMGTILDDVEGVEEVARYSTMVALNALIQAAHGDEKAFEVVAERMRELSQSLIALNKKIRTHTEDAKKALEETERATSDIAATNIDFVTKAQGETDVMMKKARALNLKMDDSIRQIAAANNEIEENVSVAITSMQFEDMLTQLTQHIRERAEALNSLFDKTGQTVLEKNINYLSEIQTVMKELAPVFEKLEHVSIHQQNTEEGEVELF